MRILARVALWPFRMALTVLEWAVLFVTHFVGIGCYLMAGFCYIIAVAGWLMGLAPVEETVRTLEVGVGFFLSSIIGAKLVIGIALINHRISELS